MATDLDQAYDPDPETDEWGQRDIVVGGRVRLVNQDSTNRPLMSTGTVLEDDGPDGEPRYYVDWGEDPETGGRDREYMYERNLEAL
jgi:hypothetical protein